MQIPHCVGGVTADPCGVPRSSSARVPSGSCSGAASHRFTYSTTHGASVCALHSLDDQVVPDAVEELRDVEIDDPVAFPASFLAPLGRVQSRPARPVPVGIVMEHRFHALPDAWPRPSGRLCRRRSRCPASWCRRRAVSVSPPPAPAEGSTSPTTSGSRSCTGCSSDRPRSRRWTDRPPLVRPDCLHLPEGLPDLPLRNIKRLALRLQLAHAVPPRPTARLTRRTQPRMTLPLGSAPITEASQLPRAGPPARLATVLSPSRFRPLGRLRLAALTRAAVSSRAFSVPRRRSRPGSRHLYAGHHLANQRAPARLIPGPFEHPGFDAI